jgi:hypothetical protein
MHVATGQTLRHKKKGTSLSADPLEFFVSFRFG